MLKRFMVAIAAITLAAPVWARNIAFPANDPVATIVVPDNWKTDKIERGYEMHSPDDDVYFSIESATGAKNAKQLIADNDAWMKKNKIKIKGGPKEQKVDIGGLEANIASFEAEDENGPTQIEFAFIAAGGRMILFTLWGSEEEQADHKKELDAMIGSIKAIK